MNCHPFCSNRCKLADLPVEEIKAILGKETVYKLSFNESPLGPSLLDDSYGGDGILVKKEIQSAADLKGKKVAFEVGSTSHLLMLTVLKKAGLTDKDVEVVPMSAGDAGAAFMAGKVDAAVTWEPWLSKGASANGKVLVSTKDLPGIIVDSISFRKEVIEKRPDDVKAFVAAMAEAMDYWKANKDESDQIMAKGLKIDLKEFTSTVPGLKFLYKEDNKKLFGTSARGYSKRYWNQFYKGEPRLFAGCNYRCSLRDSYGDAPNHGRIFRALNGFYSLYACFSIYSPVHFVDWSR